MTILNGNVSQDLKELKNKYDAIVVGSGAGGGLVSEKLSLSGLSVLLIEMGPYKTAKDFNLNEGEAYLSLYQDGTNRYTKDKGIKVLQGRCVGGGTTVNWTSIFRTPDLVLSHWKDHYGWSQKMIADYKNKFSYIESKFNISQWQMPPNENNHILKKGLDKLNITNDVIPRNVKDCHNLGYCGMGCPKDAKQSTLVTCVPHFLKNKGTLLHSAEVQKFVEGKSDMTVTLSNGLKIKSDHLFICSGGVGSPTLLKRSSLKDDKQLVGKRTFLHPVIASSAIFEDEVLPFYGAPQSVYSDHFIENSKGCGFKLEVPPVHPVLLSSIVPFHGKEHRNALKSISNLNAIISLFRDGFHKESVGGSVSLNEYQKPEVDYQNICGIALENR
ncbi:GMC family oxidoreductase N-terminal domain-containing protein [Bacteriovoracaceae bacterium]|nr:GMC family oxidoreductase N-terminal domain-containing protein [Bacteriovoracaceae bacterium]